MNPYTKNEDVKSQTCSFTRMSDGYRKGNRLDSVKQPP